MIEEFKDIILKYFEAEGKILKRENIVLRQYIEIKQYAIGFFETTLPDFEYYEVIYDGIYDKFTLDVYKKIKSCKITRTNEE